MKHRHQVEKLAKFLTYVLGRQPDEFGLVPNTKGYVKIKDLMKALNEEAGWRHVRKSHIHEVLCTAALQSLEAEGNQIRAVDRTHLILPEYAQGTPKLLYHPVRRRGYAVILEKGIRAGHGDPRIVLAREISMAERLGRRIDPAPVILTVNTDHLKSTGAALFCFGNQLLLTDTLPIGSFSGPPLPEKRDPGKMSDTPVAPARPKTPGSYFIDISSASSPPKNASKRTEKQKNRWKRDRKHKSRTGDGRWPGK
ncbi:hypothetical protein DSCO28_13280 [Desulfosarcina ovata subsp. sediminis]|uniref:RNA 2'-phosphotransferase n=1 Tax=Desulfosarcina ovata subsp. sediminis TaxID=885957 RepID=A0A5K7ZFA9_9BACT|nr:RNA 2'-phosphotransferase [Desulfosarcina ovata]BBO80762.1 hypothetical protein DSCO28_13280 [Desulfosarcina ovata subsp. sediminis]